MVNIKKNEYGFGIILPLLALVLIIGVCVAGWYVWARQTQTENNDSQKVKTGSQDDSIDGAGNEYVDFKEQGVRIRVPKELKGLTYENFGSTDELTTPGFKKVVEKCFGIEGNPAIIATVGTSTGQYTDDKDPDTVLLKQFDDFYIVGQQGSSFEVSDCMADGVDKDYKINERTKLFNALVESYKSATKL